MNTGHRYVSIVAVITVVAMIIVGCASASPVPTPTPTPIPQPAELKTLKLGDWVIVTGSGGAVSLDCYGVSGDWMNFGNPNDFYARCEGYYVPTVPRIGEVAKITLDEEEGQWKNGDAIYACAITCGWFPVSSLGVGVTPTPTLLELFPPPTETPVPTPTPTSSPTPICVRFHKVVAGDTLLGIAQKYGLDVVQLGEWNGLKYPYLILVGQSLRLCPK